MNACIGISVGINSILLILSVLEELESYLLEERVRKYVLVLLKISCGNLRAQSVKLGSEIVCGTVIDNLCVLTEDLLDELVPIIYGEVIA